MMKKGSGKAGKAKSRNDGYSASNVKRNSLRGNPKLKARMMKDGGKAC